MISLVRSSAIWKGLAPSARIAAKGSATAVTSEPNSEMVEPLQSFKKSRLRHSGDHRVGNASAVFTRAE